MERNYGIDFLKVISMLMIITLHIIGHGGILGSVTGGEPRKFAVVWALEIFAYCGVNIFALISGFVAWNNAEKTVKLSKFIYLWIGVVFYSVLITGIFRYIYPNDFNEINWEECIAPVTNNTYWYFTAYAYMFMLSPILNHMAVTLEKDKFTKCILFIIVAFSVYPTFTRERVSVFLLNDGYSFMWLAALYLIGLYINKYKVYKGIKIKTSIIILLALYVITFTMKMVYYKDADGTGDMLISYISPTILFASICWLLICARFKLSKVVGTVFKFLAPTTLGVYLIHDNDLIRNYVIGNKFSYIAEMRVYQIVFYIIISVVLIFLICSCIDKLKDLIFRLLCIKRLSETIERVIISIFSELSKLVVHIGCCDEDKG